MFGFLFLSLTITGCCGMNLTDCQAVRNPDLTNMHSNVNILQIYENVGSNTQCILLCLSEEDCSRIYFNAVDEVCQTHYTSPSPEAYTPRPGGMFYEMECRRGCPENLGYLSYSDLLLCYKISPERKTWNDARVACIEESGDLLKLNLLEKHVCIKDQLNENDNYYIGGSDDDVDGSWEWVDGESVSGGYTKWASNQPNGSPGWANCMVLPGVMYFDWADVSCAMEEYFICEIKI